MKQQATPWSRNETNSEPNPSRRVSPTPVRSSESEEPAPMELEKARRKGTRAAPGGGCFVLRVPLGVDSPVSLFGGSFLTRGTFYFFPGIRLFLENLRKSRDNGNPAFGKNDGRKEWRINP